jgi:ribosome-associated protein
VDTAEDKKAEDIVLLDLRPDTVIADFFVICNGTSDRQLRALNDYIRQAIREKYGIVPHATEGTPESGWIVMDYGDVIVHIFTAAERDYYDLAGFWSKASVLVSIQ